MKTKRVSAFAAQVDLRGLPAARLRAALLALSSPEAAEVFDAQLADLHAEWLAVRERSRLRAAWLGLGIRAQLLTCAAYYLCASLGVPALRSAAIVTLAAYITLVLFFGLAAMIAPPPLSEGEKIKPRIIDLGMPARPEPPKPSDLPRKPRPPERSTVDRDWVSGTGARGPGDARGLPPGPHGSGPVISEPPALIPPGPPAFGNNFLCLPMVRSEPEYPTVAFRRRIEGSVLVQVAIDRSGAVSDAEVLQAEPAGVFDDAVLRAVRRWRYKVSDAAGASCERTQVRLRFQLPAGAR